MSVYKQMRFADGRVDSSAGEPTQIHISCFLRSHIMPNPDLLQYGSFFNVPIETYYIEDDTEVSNIPDTAPIGSIAFVNESNNFHALMKQRSGDWNVM